MRKARKDEETDSGGLERVGDYRIKVASTEKDDDNGEPVLQKEEERGERGDRP